MTSLLNSDSLLSLLRHVTKDEEREKKYCYCSPTLFERNGEGALAGSSFGSLNFLDCLIWDQLGAPTLPGLLAGRRLF